MFETLKLKAKKHNSTLTDEEVQFLFTKWTSSIHYDGTPENSDFHEGIYKVGDMIAYKIIISKTNNHWFIDYIEKYKRCENGSKNGIFRTVCERSNCNCSQPHD